MPELPEVETIVAGLRPLLTGETITTVSYCDWPATLGGDEPAAFCAALAGAQVTGVTRRAKYILVGLTGDRLLAVHLRMTGGLVFHTAPAPPAKSTRLIFDLASGAQLHFTDTRKFGRVRLLDADAGTAFLSSLGPEPLPDTFTVDHFRARLHGRRGRLKPTLLDQRVLVGLGNIYVDEALYRSRLHPQTAVHTLDAAATARLYAAIRAVLGQAIANRGTSFSDYRDALGEKGGNQLRLQVYGRKDEPCLECGAPIERIVVGGRGTHYCPRCQPLAG
jgi:formamidopyrimidine-DNA glycosylase